VEVSLEEIITKRNHTRVTQISQVKAKEGILLNLFLSKIKRNLYLDFYGIADYNRSRFKKLPKRDYVQQILK
jgi:hypothetical protein